MPMSAVNGDVAPIARSCCESRQAQFLRGSLCDRQQSFKLFEVDHLCPIDDDHIILVNVPSPCSHSGSSMESARHLISDVARVGLAAEAEEAAQITLIPQQSRFALRHHEPRCVR